MPLDHNSMCAINGWFLAYKEAETFGKLTHLDHIDAACFSLHAVSSHATRLQLDHMIVQWYKVDWTYYQQLLELTAVVLICTTTVGLYGLAMVGVEWFCCN